MKINFRKLFLSILFPLLIGGFASFLTKNNMDILSNINKPLLTPPNWVFPVVWTILYILMGISFYIVSNNGNVCFSYYIQLFFNWLWTLIFFNVQNFLISFLILILLWIFIIIMIICFYKENKLSAHLQIPYLLWVTFAGYLNLAIFLIN